MPTNPQIDIIAQIIAQVIEAKPADEFCKSIQHQYMERGGLSKKQLEGLLGKAQKIATIQPSKIVTLQAIIKKKHITHKSVATLQKPIEQKDEEANRIVEAILHQYPQHKRVLFFKLKLQKENILSLTEKEELIKFSKLLKIAITN